MAFVLLKACPPTAAIGQSLGVSGRLFFDNCWASNPSATVQLTIPAVVVVLSIQVLEAFIGLKF